VADIASAPVFPVTARNAEDAVEEAALTIMARFGERPPGFGAVKLSLKHSARRRVQRMVVRACLRVLCDLRGLKLFDREQAQCSIFRNRPLAPLPAQVKCCGG
jgi:hypothetical protein